MCQHIFQEFASLDLMILQAPTQFYVRVKIATRGKESNKAIDMNKIFKKN